MALPILETARYELTLPSHDKKIAYRPFLVKEEKLLLMALESGENKQVTTALKDIVNACTFGAINVDVLPTFDIEYIFLNIRAKSVGEVAKLQIKCPDDGETFANIELDLNQVEVQVDDEHTNVIPINDQIKMVMRYPTLDSFDPTMDAGKMKTNDLFDIISKSISEIYDGDTVHKASDYSKEELNTFIESLTSDHFAKVQKFFTTMPRLAHVVEVENPKTKVKSKVTLSGLNDFFVSPSLTTT